MPKKYNYKSKPGRRTDYGPHIIEETKNYILNYKTLQDDVIPSVAGLAFYLEIARDTIYDWARQADKKEFSYILGTLLSNQERALLNGGVSKRFDSGITKLVLGKHGYKEHKDVTSDDKPINKDMADAINKALDEDL